MKERDGRAGIVLSSLTGLLIGAGAAFAAERYFSGDKGDVYGRSNDLNTLVVPTPFAQENLLVYPTPVPRLEGPLNAEVLKSIQGSLVRFGLTPKLDLENYRFPAFGCNGFVIRDGSGRSLVATARHCFPEQVQSGADGKTYPTSYKAGESIFTFNITDINGKSSEVFPYNFYLGQDAPDVMLFDVPNENFSPRGLSLNLDNPSPWETLHRVSLSESGLATHPFQLVDNQIGQSHLFVSVSQPDNACFPGTSGSAIVNAKGEVVSLVSRTTLGVITEETARQFSIDSTKIGQPIAHCWGPNANLIKGLIRNQ